MAQGRGDVRGVEYCINHMLIPLLIRYVDVITMIFDFDPIWIRLCTHISRFVCHTFQWLNDETRLSYGTLSEKEKPFSFGYNIKVIEYKLQLLNIF